MDSNSRFIPWLGRLRDLCRIDPVSPEIAEAEILRAAFASPLFDLISDGITNRTPGKGANFTTAPPEQTPQKVAENSAKSRSHDSCNYLPNEVRTTDWTKECLTHASIPFAYRTLGGSP